MIKRFLLLVTLLNCISVMAFGDDASAKKDARRRTTIEIKPKRIKPLSVIGEVESYYIHDTCELSISFPVSEGWAELVVSTPMGELVHKERFHTGFEFSTYIGVPDMPWKIEVTTTQGGEYEGWLILQE